MEDEHKQRSDPWNWASAASFIAVLIFIGTLVYLAHNHWHF